MFESQRPGPDRGKTPSFEPMSEEQEKQVGTPQGSDAEKNMNKDRASDDKDE